MADFALNYQFVPITATGSTATKLVRNGKIVTYFCLFLVFFFVSSFTLYGLHIFDCDIPSNACSRDLNLSALDSSPFFACGALFTLQLVPSAGNHRSNSVSVCFLCFIVFKS